MRYCRAIVQNFKLLLNSFSFNYDPPNAPSLNPQTLKVAIEDCSKQGKLLIIHFTKNGKLINIPLEFQPDNFFIYTTPYNSRESYEVSQHLQCPTLPYAALYFCPTRHLKDIEFLQSLTTMQSLSTVHLHFERKMQILFNKREDYQNIMTQREVVDEQNQEYDRIINEIHQEEERQLQLEETERKKAEHIERQIQEVKKRYNSLPPEPSSSDPNKITIKAMLPGSGSKQRMFSNLEPISHLLDWIGIDLTPIQFNVSYGYPQKIISYKDFDIINQTFKEGQFAKNDVVYISIEEEEEEEENNENDENDDDDINEEENNEY